MSSARPMEMCGSDRAREAVEGNPLLQRAGLSVEPHDRQPAGIGGDRRDYIKSVQGRVVGRSECLLSPRRSRRQHDDNRNDRCKMKQSCTKFQTRYCILLR